MKCPTRGKRFYCREWVFSKLLTALDSPSSSCMTLSNNAPRPSSSTSSAKSLGAGGGGAEDNGTVRDPTIVLVGGAGSGKTAVCSEIVWPTVHISRQSELNARLLACHFCRLDDAGTLSISGFLCSLVRQLIDSPHLPDFKDRLLNEPKRRAWLSSATGSNVDEADGPNLLTPDGEEVNGGGGRRRTAAATAAVRAEQYPKEAFKKTVLEPLNECSPPKDNNGLLLLVDLSHDDSCTSVGYVCASSAAVELLAAFRRQLPKWLTLVITTRRQCRFVSRAFHGCRRIVLDDLRRSCVVRDVQQYILHRLDEDEPLRMQLNLETAEMLNRLHIKSNGCLLYLELVLDGVCDGFAALSESQHIPSTLNGLYLWLCQRLFPRKHYFAKIQPIFDVMLATKRPLTADELFQCVRTSDVAVPVDEFLERMKSVSRLLWVDEERCTFFHHSFAEWLLDVKYATQKYLCDKSAGHSYLAMWYSARGPELSLDECVEFAYHLSKMRIKAPLDESHLPLWLVQSGAPVQRLVLANFAYDEATTRLLIDAGADFVSLDFRRQSQISSSCAQLGDGGEDDRQSCSMIDEDGEEETGDRRKESNTNGKVSRRTESDHHRNEKATGIIGQGGGGGVGVDCVSDEALLTDETAVDAEGRSCLHNASSDGRTNLVKSLLARGAFCDVEDHNGDTPLILASRHGHSAICELLLESGSDANHRNREGWTALRSASWGGHLAVIETLLRYDVSVDCCAADGRTALRAAAWGGHDDCVRILLSVGAETNKQDADGRSALMAAAYMGHADVVDILLHAGADPNVRDRDGRTGLSVAAVCSSATPVDHVGVARLLLDRGSLVDSADNNGKTPLQCAASEGNEAMCRLLLERGADVDHTDSNQCTPLLAAAAVGHGSVVQLLLQYGADIDSIDSDGRTVLTVAAAHGSFNVVRMLLEKGLDEMHKDNAGWIPLHHSAFEGHPEVCRLLCEYNPKTVHVIDNEGRHPLLLAVEEGQTEVARCLIEYGANVNKPSLDGQTSLRMAAVAGNKPLCHLLISRGADVDYNDLDGRSTLYALIFERQLEMAEHLLSFGTRVDNRDPQGRTPLHVAAWQGDLTAVELLIKYGADVDGKDNEENTPLMLAVWRGHLSVVKCLLSHRADVNAWASTEQGGASALSIAAQEGREDIVRLLLQHNADSEHADRYGRTPCVVAQKAGKEKIVALLNDFQQHASTNSHLLMPNGATTNTTLSGSSGETKASSGYMSLSQALCNSLESPFATVSFAHPASPSNTVGGGGGSGGTKEPATAAAGSSAYSGGGKMEKRTTTAAAASAGLSSLRSAGRMTGGSSSNKSTLSSTCGSPDDDFSRRLLEHSVPKYVMGGSRSRPSSVIISATFTTAKACNGRERHDSAKDNGGEAPTTSSILRALSSLLAGSDSGGDQNGGGLKQLSEDSRENSEEKTTSSSITSNRPSEASAIERLKECVTMDDAPKNGTTTSAVVSSSTDSDTNTESRHSRIRIVTNPNFRQSSSTSSCSRSMGTDQRSIGRSTTTTTTSTTTTTTDDRGRKDDSCRSAAGGGEVHFKKETQL